MSQFTGTAPFYRAYRPGVPDEVTAILVGAANRDAAADTLLDLGTGTGQVVRALHQHFRDIIAVDPEVELLDLAEADLRPCVSPGNRLQLVHSSAEVFTPPPGWKASLVTVCRAFHWMDQPFVLERLARFTTDTGVVAVFGDNSFWTADSAWKRAVRAVIQDFLGQERRAGSGAFSHHDKPYSEILAESPFSDVEESTVPVRRTWTTETILGYLYSTSFAAQHLFGDRLGAFESEAKSVLAEHSDDDTFPEDNEFVIRIGRKERV